MGEHEREGKGTGVLPGGRVHAGHFVLRAESLGEVLGEDLNKIFISFMLMRQNEIYSLSFICLCVWLANGTNWISAFYLSQ